MFHTASPVSALPLPLSGANVHQWLSLGWQFRWWGIAGLLAGASLAVATSALVTPSYRASAQIFIDPQNLQLLERDLTPSTASGDAGVVLIESQARVMASDSVLRATASRLHLDTDPEFVGRGNPLKAMLDGLFSGSETPPDDLSRAVNALAKAVHVVRLDRTYVVDVYAESESPLKAAEIANTVVSSYLALRETQRAEQAGRASASLEARLAQLLGELETAENAVEQFRISNGIVEAAGQSLLEGRVGQTSQALLAANTAVEAARVQRTQLQALAAQPDQLLAMPEAVGSPDVSRLLADLQAARAEADSLSATLGPRHPRRATVDERLASARAAIDAEVTRLLAAAELTLARAEQNAAALQQQMATATANLQDTDARRIRLRQLEREAEASRAVYEDALLRSRETAEQARLDTINAQIVSRAVAPIERSFPPKLSLLLPLGMVGGLAAGLALGLMRRRSSTQS